MKGIVTGCTVSVVPFIMGMNLLINATRFETRGPTTARNQGSISHLAEVSLRISHWRQPLTPKLDGC